MALNVGLSNNFQNSYLLANGDGSSTVMAEDDQSGYASSGNMPQMPVLNKYNGSSAASVLNLNINQPAGSGNVINISLNQPGQGNQPTTSRREAMEGMYATIANDRARGQNNPSVGNLGNYSNSSAGTTVNINLSPQDQQIRDAARRQAVEQNPSLMSNQAESGSGNNINVSIKQPESQKPESALTKKLGDITGFQKGIKPNSKLPIAAKLVETIMNDPRWKAAEAKRMQELVADNGPEASQMNVFNRSVLHSEGNAMFLNNTTQSGNLNAIQGNAGSPEQVIKQILRENVGSDVRGEKLLMAWVHHDITGVDLSDNISDEPEMAEQANPNLTDTELLKDKPVRAAFTMSVASEKMDDLAKLTALEWNHDIIDNKLDNKIDIKKAADADKNIIAPGVNMLGPSEEILSTLKQIDPEATTENVYQVMGYNDIVANWLKPASQQKKINSQALAQERLEKLAQTSNKPSLGQTMKQTFAKVQQHVSAFAKSQQEITSALVGGAAGTAAAVASGCPYCGMTVGMGSAMGMLNKLRG